MLGCGFLKSLLQLIGYGKVDLALDLDLMPARSRPVGELLVALAAARRGAASRRRGVDPADPRVRRPATGAAPARCRQRLGRLGDSGGARPRGRSGRRRVRRRRGARGGGAGRREWPRGPGRVPPWRRPGAAVRRRIVRRRALRVLAVHLPRQAAGGGGAAARAAAGGRLALSDVSGGRRRSCGAGAAGRQAGPFRRRRRKRPLPPQLGGTLATVACVGGALSLAGYEGLLGGRASRISARELCREDADHFTRGLEERLRGARLLGIAPPRGRRSGSWRSRRPAWPATRSQPAPRIRIVIGDN